VKPVKTVTRLLVLVLALTLIGGACQKTAVKDLTTGLTEKAKQVTQPTDQTKAPVDWQEYTSQTHKFSFHYGSDWELRPEIDREDLLTFFLVVEDENQEKRKNELTGEMMTCEYMISVRVEDNPDNLSAKEHELSRYIPQGRDTIAAGLEDITVAGIEGYKHSGPRTPPSSGDFTEIKLAPGNGKVYSFVYSAAAHPDTHEKYLEEFEQILETLEFSQ
jgi:hypothetical protein